MIGFINTLYIHTVRNYRKYSAIADLHTFRFTVAHALGFLVFTSRILATDLRQSHCNFKWHVKSSCRSLIPFFPLFCSCQFRRLDSTAVPYSLLLCFYCSFESEFYVTTDGQSASQSWNKAPICGLRPDLYYCQLPVCWCGALSLTRGRICRLQLLLALASAVILGSEPLGTRDLILLSQIWDFPFRRLLRLAGSQWRYSTPPPNGFTIHFLSNTSYNHSARTPRKTPSRMRVCWFIT
jgi:hypothetical protein